MFALMPGRECTKLATRDRLVAADRAIAAQQKNCRI